MLQWTPAEKSPFSGIWLNPIHFTQPRGSSAGHIDRKPMNWVMLPIPLPGQSSPRAQAGRERVAQGDVQGTAPVLVQELHSCWLCSDEPQTSKKRSSSLGQAPNCPLPRAGCRGVGMEGEGGILVHFNNLMAGARDVPDLHTAPSSLNTIDPLAGEKGSGGGRTCPAGPNRHHGSWRHRGHVMVSNRWGEATRQQLVPPSWAPRASRSPVPSTLNSPSAEQPGPMDMHFEMLSYSRLCFRAAWLLVGKGVGLCVPLGHL